MKKRSILLVLLLITVNLFSLPATATIQASSTAELVWELNTDLQAVFGFYEDENASEKMTRLDLSTEADYDNGIIKANGEVYVKWKFRSKESVNIRIETSGLRGGTSQESIPLYLSWDNDLVGVSSGVVFQQTIAGAYNGSKKITITTGNAIGVTPHEYSGNVYLIITAGGNQ